MITLSRKRPIRLPRDHSRPLYHSIWGVAALISPNSFTSKKERKKALSLCSIHLGRGEEKGPARPYFVEKQGSRKLCRRPEEAKGRGQVTLVQRTSSLFVFISEPIRGIHESFLLSKLSTTVHTPITSVQKVQMPDQLITGMNQTCRS